MKKITFLLSLLLASAGVTASAQDSYTWKKLSADADLTKAVTSLDALQNGGTYAFYSVGKSKYVKIDKYDYNNLHFGNTASLTASDEDAGLAVFTFHITKSGETTTYTFETGVNGMYMGAPQDGATKASATAANFVIQTTDSQNKSSESGNFCIKSTTGNANSAWFDMQNNQFVGWQGKDANCWYKIVPVTVSSEDVTCYKTTHTVKEGDRALDTYTEWLKSGSTATAHNFVASYYYTVSNNVSDWVVSSSNKEFEYSASKNTEIPFGADNIYALKINNSRYLTAANDNGTWYVNTLSGAFAAATYDIFSSKNWKFVESGLGVKIYNPYTEKYVKINGGNAVTLDNDGTVLYFKQAGENYALTTSTTNQYLNSSINYGGANNRLGTWQEESASNGSTLVMQNVDKTAEILSVGKSSLNSSLTIQNADATKYLTYDASGFAGAKSNVESATTVEQLNGIYNSNVKTVTVTPDVNAYYRIKSVSAADGNAYLSTASMFVGKDGNLSTAYNRGNAYDGQTLDRTITRTSASDAFVPQVWRFVKTAENAYQLKNVNTRCNSAFFGNGNLDMPVDESYGQSITLKAAISSTETADNSYVNIISGNNVIGVRGDVYFGTNAAALSDLTNIWQIEKVTTVPVSITDAKYATVAFPFATKVATAGVKAYYATGAADGMITLVEYPEGIIPANQGALLYNEAGATTANLTVEATDKTVEGNILMPATAKRAGFTANDTYVLAKNSANEAAFLKNGLTVVPANKAYVATENIPAGSSSNVLNFNFGQVTGINGVVAADKAGVQYFDLQGRRVLYPAHGIFVTNTGKKVFVK